MTVGENIRKLRKEKGLTQKQLGELCGINEVQIRRYELGGENSNPKIETLHKIAKALGKSIILLVEGCEDKYPLSMKDYQIDIDNSMTDEEKKIFDIEKDNHKLLFNLKPGETVQTTDIRENKLLSDYRQLNGSGRMEAIKRVEELTEIKRYTEPDEPPAE